MFSLIVAADCSSCLFGQNLGFWRVRMSQFARESPTWRIRGDEEGHNEHFWPLALFQFYVEDLWHKGVARCILSVKKKCKTPTPQGLFFVRIARLQHFKTMKLHLNFWYFCFCRDSNFHVSHHGQEHDSQTSPDVVEACPGRCRTSMTWKRKGWEPWHLGPKNVSSPKKRRGKSVGNYTEILHAMHARTYTDHIISVFIATKISNWICIYQFSSFFKMTILDPPN